VNCEFIYIFQSDQPAPPSPHAESKATYVLNSGGNYGEFIGVFLNFIADHDILVLI